MIAWKSRLHAVGIAFVGAASSNTVHANAPARAYRSEAEARSIALAGPTRLVVEDERIEITCARDATCRFTATYAVVNPDDVPRGAAGAFYGEARSMQNAGRTSVEVKLDGRRISTELDSAALRALDDAYRASVAPEAEQRLAGAPERAFRFVLGPHARATLVFDGELHPTQTRESREFSSYTLSALRTRHMLVGSSDGRSDHRYRYLIAPLRMWGGSPQVHVHIRAHGTVSELSPTRERWNALSSGDEELSTTFAAKDVDDFAFEVSDPGPLVALGGPVLGIGGRLDEKELRLRAGFEFSSPNSAFVEGVSVETNLSDYFTVVPTVEVASPQLLIIPSLGLGAGVPIRVDRGTARVGVRGQISLVAPVLGGIQFPIDYYPAADARGGHWDLSLAYRFSL